MASENQFDFVVIGGGIAGASVAYELARDGRVAVLEMEEQPGYHTTGRSAALFTESYGPPAIRQLTRSSRAFFENPQDDICGQSLLSTRGVLYIARKEQTDSLSLLQEKQKATGAIESLDASELISMVPLLRPDYVVAGLLESGASDIDVNTLHQGYLRGLKQRDGRVLCGHHVEKIVRNKDGWALHTRKGAVFAPVIINAAGAWADEVAELVGTRKVGLEPKRRTMLAVDVPGSVEADSWPAVIDIDEEFYFKPDAGRFLISPADETPSPPCDAQPEELDIAICIDRIQTAFDLDISRIGTSWAGLRSFVADGNPVCGFDPEVDGFFWLAGQGGYGIQSAPGLSRLAASLITSGEVPSDLANNGFDLSSVGPDRFG